MDKNLNITANFVDNASPGVEKLGSLLAEFGEGLAVGAIVAAGALVVDKFAEMTKAAIDFGDKLNDMSERWGVSTEALSGMAYSAQLADTSLEGITGGFRHLAKAMDEARDPSSETADLFNQMGISVTDLNGKTKDAETMMGELADQFKDMPNGIDKARLAIQIFGKSGAELIPYLNQGADGIKKMKEEADGFGLNWTEEASKQAAEFNDNLDRLKMAGQGFFTLIAQYLLPTLGDVTAALVQSAKEGGVLRSVFDAIRGVVVLLNEIAFKPLAIVTYAITAAFGMLGKAIGGVAASLVAFLSGDMKGAKDIIANIGEDVKKTGQEIYDFGKKMYSSKDGTEAAGDAAEKAVPKVNKLGEAVKKVQENIDKYIASLKKTRDEIGANDEMKQQIELEAKLLELKKQGASVKQINETRAQAQQIIEETNARRENWDMLQKQLDAETKLNDVRKNVISTTEDIRFENSIMNLSNEERKIAIELRKLEKSLIGASKEEIAKLTAERRKELEVQTEQNKLDGLLADTIDAKTEKSRVNMQILTKALEAGTISEAQYLEAVQLEMERLSGKSKKVADEMTEFFKEAARNIQNAMGDLLFDFMQGKLSDMGSQIKSMIDRMVANFLAAKAATALFGADFGTTGNVGGLVGDVFGAIAGARAEGGPVEAGKTYIVGERRAELFTPSTSGYISPDTSALSGGGNVSINISALDGSDVMRVLNSRKKEIATMVSSTNRTYNLRG